MRLRPLIVRALRLAPGLAIAARFAGAQGRPPAVAPAAQTAAQTAAQSCAPARTALVLSGGAVKGFAHIGVLHVLDSIGVRPDLIVGTSVGAMVGSLYASGYSAREVDSLMRAMPFADILRRYEPRVSSSLGLLKSLAVWERGRTGYRLQTGAAREAEVNALIASVTLRGNLLARGSFDSLPIPLRVVATDFLAQRAVLIGEGDLGLAVRASVAIPLLFLPVRSDTTWLMDGGLSANTPVSLARSLGAERLWISRLPYARPDPNAFDDPLTVSEALVNALVKDDRSPPSDGDVTILNPTYDFEVLDFRASTTDSLVKLGRNTARAAFGAAGCLRPLNAALGAGARGAAELPMRVGRVTVGAAAPDGPAVLAGLGVVQGRTLDFPHVQRAIRQVGTSERIQAVWLHPGGSGPDVTFRPMLEPAPRRAFGVGVAFDQFMSGRLWVGGVDRSVFGVNAEGAAITRFGTYEQDVLGFLRVHADFRGGHLPVAVGARLAHESVRLFTGDGELPNAETNEGEGFLGLHDDPAAGAWRYEALFDARLWREPGRDTRGSVGLRAAAFRARDDYEMATIAEGIALVDFQLVRVDASRQFDVGGLQARFRVRAGWGNRLPVHHTFTLGGADGFAGLRIGDIRGSQEAYAALRLQRRIAPQLSFAVEGMTGAIGSGHGFMVRRAGTDFGKVFGGIRVGFEATTPIGPIRVEEGFSNSGARALLVRVGYWF